MQATISGTISSLSGGSFQNGAMTATFAHLYNEWQHGCGWRLRNSDGNSNDYNYADVISNGAEKIVNSPDGTTQVWSGNENISVTKTNNSFSFTYDDNFYSGSYNTGQNSLNVKLTNKPWYIPKNINIISDKKNRITVQAGGYYFSYR